MSSETKVGAPEGTDEIPLPASKPVGRLRRFSDNIPLRVQLVVVSLVLVIFGLAATGVAATSALRGYLIDRVDTQLNASAHDRMGGRGFPFGDQNAIAGTAATPNLNSTTTTTPGTTPTTGNPNERPTGPALVAGFYSEVVDASGVGQGALRVPTGAHQSAPKLPTLTASEVRRLGTKPFTVDAIGEGADWRVEVQPLSDRSGTIVVATDLSDINNTVHRLQLIDLVVSTIVVLLLAVLSYLLVRNRLQKLVEVEQTAERIAEGDLALRVPNAGPRTEVGRLASALNTMLEQIETAFAAQKESEEGARASEGRMRRFIADASHELRTPLTSIRGFAELHRQGAATTVEDTAHMLTRIEGEAKRMGVLVEDLLLLARLDQQRPFASEPVNLSDLIGDIVHDAPAISSDHPINLEITEGETGAPIVVAGDEIRLRQVVSNLLMNAFTHTPAGTHVSVTLKVEESQAVIEVSDDGPGMVEDDANRVFERFYRSDPSRTRTSGGSGLGLSIVSGIVEAHQGTIVLKTSPGAGAKFTIRLPIA